MDRSVPSPFPSLPNLPGIATDGGMSTVDAATHDARANSVNGFMFGGGPNRRYVGNMQSRLVQGQSSLPGGVSGDPRSPWFTNLLMQWLGDGDGRLFASLHAIRLLGDHHALSRIRTRRRRLADGYAGDSSVRFHIRRRHHAAWTVSNRDRPPDRRRLCVRALVLPAEPAHSRADRRSLSHLAVLCQLRLAPRIRLRRRRTPR